MKTEQIEKIVKNKTNTNLRPNIQPTSVDTIVKLISKFILICILFIFIGYFICEYFNIYPFETTLSDKYNTKTKLLDNSKESIEGFTTIVKNMFKPSNESLYPKTGTQVISIFNNKETNDKLEGVNLDMDVIRSQRYYQSLLNSPEAILNKQQGLDINQHPKLRINSLIQELPVTYMISNLRNIKESNTKNIFTINNDNNKFNDINALFNNNTIKEAKDLLNLNLKTNTYHKDINKLFSICKLYITTLINIELINNKQSHAAHPFQFLSSIASQNLLFKANNSSSLVPKSITVIFNIILYRYPKTHSFNIQCKVVCNLNTNSNNEQQINCNISELELLGSTIQNNLPIKKLGMTPLLTGTELTNLGKSKIIGSPVSAQGDISGNLEETHNVSGYINPREGLDITSSKLHTEWIKLNSAKNNTINNITTNFYKSTYGLDPNKDINQSQIDNVARIKALQGYNPILYGDYKCFGIYPDGEEVALNEIQDPITCQSYHQEIQGVGIWDAKCSNNSDCPFYDPNNNQNGCDIATGKCDMPFGITRIGYTKYNKFNF